ncbi:MAG: pyridoxal-phosphate dependent enzyme [Candidatus Bathyarchaeota archaeon]|nr:pyridoxal-phosphate dependent enzyme [Candidatus Bathyarchaeota archaeon]
MAKDSIKPNSRLFKRFAEDLAQSKILRPYPIREVEGFANDRNISLLVKVEHDNCSLIDPVRSVKRKPAFMMGDFMHEFNPQKNIWVSASSGNFAIELGILAIEIDRSIFAVVPPRTPRQRIETLRSLGVNIVKVSEEEYDLCPREFTVFMVRALASRYDNIVNVDQYNSILNPLSHTLLTAREIDDSIGKDLTHIFIPLGSTGTLAGISEYFSRFHPKVKIIGVQPTRIHRIPGVHNVVGECKWSPEIFGLPGVGAIKVLTIDDVSAYEALMELEIEYGIHGGPSTGMVFAAVKKEAGDGNIDKGSVILMMSADSSWDYREWSMEVLAELKGSLGDSGRTNLGEYMRVLESREESESRAKRVKNIYKPKSEGEVYRLEEFEGILAEK